MRRTALCFQTTAVPACAPSSSARAKARSRNGSRATLVPRRSCGPTTMYTAWPAMRRGLSACSRTWRNDCDDFPGLSRVAASPSHDLIRPDKSKRRFIERAQLRIGVTHHLQIDLRLREGAHIGRLRPKGEKSPLEMERVEERTPVGQPRMRGAATGTRGGYIAIGLIRRRHAAVGHDHR